MKCGSPHIQHVRGGGSGGAAGGGATHGVIGGGGDGICADQSLRQWPGIDELYSPPQCGHGQQLSTGGAGGAVVVESDEKSQEPSSDVAAAS